MRFKGGWKPGMPRQELISWGGFGGKVEINAVKEVEEQQKHLRVSKDCPNQPLLWYRTSSICTACGGTREASYCTPRQSGCRGGGGTACCLARS